MAPNLRNQGDISQQRDLVKGLDQAESLIEIKLVQHSPFAIMTGTEYGTGSEMALWKLGSRRMCLSVAVSGSVHHLQRV